MNQAEVAGNWVSSAFDQVKMFDFFFALKDSMRSTQQSLKFVRSEKLLSNGKSGATFRCLITQP